MTSKNMPHVGFVAKFFHPRTLGVMHRGTVVRVNDERGQVAVKFDVCGKTYWTYPEYNND